jgi:hypothetical protein
MSTDASEVRAASIIKAISDGDFISLTFVFGK